MIRSLFVLLLAAASGACNNSSGGATSFDSTVTNLIQAGTNESGAPIEVNGTSFAFPTAESAFDDVLPADTGAVVPQ
ncbi:MAG: hypothetical protein HOP15_14650 [Planctomycetes bacterium]|nr:hypothetical protein [Planctomycetota bacterium]